MRSTRPDQIGQIPLPGFVQPHDLAEDRQFAMTLARGMEVLRAFTPAETFLANREIADRTGLPRPTISRLTYTLTLLGYLNYDRTLRKYRLGPGLLSLCHPLLTSLTVRQTARHHIVDLARATGCTVNLGMLDRAGIVYIDTARATTGNQHLPDVGSNRPLLSSSIGRALLFSASPEDQDIILNQLKLLDPATFETWRPRIEEDRRRFEREGFTYSPGDWQPEIHAVAVPVKLAKRDPAMAMNCTLKVSPENSGRALLEDVAQKLKDTARQIEAAYRASGPQ
ncbi:IclR family transcriptional regulator [Oceanicola sp. 22II-s10i]|uniref:IclR family transcriptional regulator n=1 Tax=Oceanicola sp. 22II-s10i TaxID=1317116 RepID=UPI000B6E26ED|nr:IclR family transcriptional regulator [Oceanicola sp. 22II-s10i]OWU83785.1 IclR family transcriptional regulator [Oceanicola sp. 22II-s10i]